MAIKDRISLRIRAEIHLLPQRTWPRPSLHGEAMQNELMVHVRPHCQTSCSCHVRDYTTLAKLISLKPSNSKYLYSYDSFLSSATSLASKPWRVGSDGRQLAGAAARERSRSSGQAARGKSISQPCPEGRTKLQVQLVVDLWDIYWPMTVEKAKQIQSANFGLEQKEEVVESIQKSSNKLPRDQYRSWTKTILFHSTSL